MPITGYPSINADSDEPSIDPETGNNDSERDENDPISSHPNYSSRNVNNTWIGRVHRFQVNDVIDVLDSSSHWCEAEILKIDHQNQRIFVTYLYWNSTFDAWVDNIDDRTAPFHTHTYYENGPVIIGQRVEVMDEQQKWLHAYIIDVDGDRAKVHFHGYHPKFDTWINIADNKIRPYGKYSNNKANKYPKNKLWRVPKSDVHEEHKDNREPGKQSNQESANDSHNRQIRQASSQYSHYLSALEAERLRIFQVLGDGNCLFRSVAHQAYGNNELHWLVRQKCMDYMEADADFFSQFIEGGRESFDLYLRAKRRDACWGDDPEIQAISEIYHRPVEIWAYDPSRGARKLRTFHEAASMDAIRAAGSRSCPPIRLSYYGGGHYDSIVDDNFLSTIIQCRPGEVEDQALNMLKQRNALLNQSETNASSGSEAENREREAINYTIEMSRKDLCWAEEDLESILVMSLEDEAKRLGIPRSDLGTKDSAHDIVATQQQILSHVTESSENDYIEKAILSSLADDPQIAEAQLIEQAQRDSMMHTGSMAVAADADPELAAVMELSKLSEEEAFEMALKQSMEQQSAPSSSSSMKAPPVNPTASASAAYIDDDEMLNAALAASLADSSSYDFPADYLPSNYEINDDDEDISRAIAESLRRR